MRTRIFVAAVALFLLTVVRTQAAPIFTTTDLGAGYQLQSGAGGQVYDVAGANGSLYAFNKSPVTSFDPDPTTTLDNGYIQVETMQNGSHVASYIDGVSIGANLRYPSFESFNGGWSIVVGDSAYSSPISDINSQGQVVGTSQFGSGLGTLGTGPSYAMFSAVDGQSHVLGGDAFVVDNLNNYIATIPGVTLTSSVAIDDLGRIITKGSNGDYYLLTPTSLGDPATVPEPSTAAMFVLASTILAIRSIRRKGSRSGVES